MSLEDSENNTIGNQIKIGIYETLDFLAEKYRVYESIDQRARLDEEFYAFIDIIKSKYTMPRIEVNKMMDYYNRKKIML